MFDFVRNHSRLVLGILVLLIFPSFIFFGVQGYSRFTEGGAVTVAEVGGQAISRAEWDAAHQNNIERLRRQRPELDPKLLETPELKRETLDGLVRDRVLMATARQYHLVPDDARLQRLFVTDPQFAGLRNPDGSVNREILAAQGMSVEAFEQQLRQEFGMQQVLGAVAQSSFTPPAVAATSLDALLQRREVQIQRFDAAAYRAQATPGDADLQAYYEAHSGEFRAPEQAQIEYVVLDLAALAKDVAVPEEDLRRYYEENASRYTQAEERRASHILIRVDPSAPADEKKAAKARAEQLLAEVRRSPNSFAEVARKNSQDPGSASRGGDLDFFGRGMMAKPFEDAVYAMKTGEISNVIETDFGYHVITLTGLRGGQKKAFDTVRAEIEQEVRRSLAQKRYAEAAETFTNTVYEQSDSLQPVIDKLKLQKQTATVLRQPVPGASGALASAKLLDAVFSDDVVRNKRNTDAVEIGQNQLVSARIVTHSPARTLPLAEVRDQVREAVVAQKSAALAKAEGAKRLEALKKSPNEALPISLTLSRAQPQGAPRAVVDAVLRADTKQLPAIVGVDLGSQGYAVVRVSKVLQREADPATDAMLQQQLAQTWATAEALAYLDALKRRTKAEIKEAAVQAAAKSTTP
ncbi:MULTISPECIES: SurA N-terminal domain-containing protein [unclassified Rubrivivax]|uniref:SurA N-terminal domain-containing protein n=1 Tax=unclassified Rubrivivax TaxID=2649762 RepID=UPI001E45371B|nr:MULTISPECIES: SurA N-terminal domain-containing protein [unclassified Rubrivivax]MCC9596118.1 SurA N-terminal domain-containing protein [Rubrivivax sp. JA1055]MCC9647540.1 SurA N-terminal domain-containing protein [Rubrivivax sp. JA1029]